MNVYIHLSFDSGEEVMATNTDKIQAYFLLLSGFFRSLKHCHRALLVVDF